MTSPYLAQQTRKPVLWFNICDPDSQGDFYGREFRDFSDAVDDVEQGVHGYVHTVIYFDNGDVLTRDLTDEAQAKTRAARLDRDHDRTLAVGWRQA